MATIPLPLGTLLIIAFCSAFQIISVLFDPYKKPTLFCLSSTDLTTGFGFFTNIFSLFLYPFFFRGIWHFIVAAIPFAVVSSDVEKSVGTFSLFNILFVIVITL
jgi:membrane associated rhomboid family serine protease